MAAPEARSFLMAAEAAAEIVSQKLEILLYDPVCIGCLSLETRVKDSKATLATIQEFSSTEYRLVESMEWWGRFLRLMFYSEEFIDKFRLREARERKKAQHVAARPLAWLVSRYMLWRDLSYLVKSMKELCQARNLPDKEAARGEGKKELASALWQEEKRERLTNFWDPQRLRNYQCREIEKWQIMKWIEKSVDLGVQAISILGEQGAGKTFLARKVYGEASRYQSFEWRVWVHVSTCVDQRELLLEILKQVENLLAEGEDLDFYEIKKMLCQKLTRTKRFLIVLDDVRPSHEELLRGLVMIIPPCSQGHIITTTEDHRIALIMNTSAADPIRLTNLSYEESRRIITLTFARVPNGLRLIEEIDLRSIYIMYHGLPLYISLLGGVLLNAVEHEGKKLAREVSTMTASDILQYSYLKLPVHLKPCFIYMALFPVAFPIPTRRLVRLWLAEGLLDSHYIGGPITRLPEDVGETFILQLALRNVIDVVSWRADGSPKACRMLTSLYDMICPIAMSMRLLHIHATSKSKDENNRGPTSQQQQLQAQPRERIKIPWLAEHTNIVTDSHGSSYPDLKLSHVRSFLSFYLRRGMLTKDISTFLRKMTSETDYSLLRVLDLEGVYKPSLHGLLHKLVLLRYLGLRSTLSDSIPRDVVDLHYLETLDIKHTNITSLPSSLWKARNLRHLHLNWFYIDLKKILKANSNDAMALTKLQTLSGLVIGDVNENLTRDSINRLTPLTTLKLFLRRSDGATSVAAGQTVADWISFRLTKLQSLTFGVIRKAKPATEAKPAISPIGPLPELTLANRFELFELYLLGQLNKPIWTQLLPGSLRVLTLSGSRVVADMMPELGGLLKNLRTLRLLANSFLGTILRFARGGFPSLMILKIWKLPRLEEVIIEQGAMPHLKELEFRHLDRMQTVLGIKECEELESIYLGVKKGAHFLVNHLKSETRARANLYVREDTKTPGSMEEDEEDSDDDIQSTASP